MKRFWKQRDSDDPHTWIGPEATVGAQAGKYLRYRGRHVAQEFTTILWLSLISGFTLGYVFCQLWKDQAK